MSHVYDVPPAVEDSLRLLRTALHEGVRMLDTATLHRGGHNEELVGRVIAGRREEVLLDSNGGMSLADSVKRIDGRAETLRAQADASPKRLGTDHIDLRYLQRCDRAVPVGESVGALAEMMGAGKIGVIGPSEISVARLREADNAAPIVAVQNEYSLWSRNPEATRASGVALVALSPAARGFLRDGVPEPAMLAPTDIPRSMPRFRRAHWPHNAGLVPRWGALAVVAGCTLAQLALAWPLSRVEPVAPIPDTTNPAHLRENLIELGLSVDRAPSVRAGDLIDTSTVSSPRYAPGPAAYVDTGEFEAVE